MQRLIIGVFTLVLTGCSTFGLIENDVIEKTDKANSYSMTKLLRRGTSDNALALAFSGGGTRAAALSYGVLKALRDSPIKSGGKTKRLLDEVDTISSVSGGSFTAAYYGLHGDNTFLSFEDAFLRRNVSGGVKKTLLNPGNWFDERGLSELTVDLYQEQVFHYANYDDMLRAGAPLIMINASDLSKGVRFSFVQEYFDLLCSDLSTFPVARAVAASAAVPVVFDPIVLKNYDNCKSSTHPWLEGAMVRSRSDDELLQTIKGLESYNDKKGHKYAHFVDGGITDNLGLRAIYDVLELGGGAKKTAEILKLNPVKRFVIISVDAAAKPINTMDKSNLHPSLFDTVNATSDVQLSRYNASTLDLMKRSMDRWSEQLSTPTQKVEPYFIQLNFSQIQNTKTRAELNEIPTTFNLPDSQVDLLIKAGKDLLVNNSEFKRLMADIKASN